MVDPMPNPIAATPRTHTPIDLARPTQALAVLKCDPQALVDLVNGGRLPAYDLEGNIRFRVGDLARLGGLSQDQRWAKPAPRAPSTAASRVNTDS